MMKLFFSILFIFYAGEKSWGNDTLDKLESYTELRRYMVESGVRPDAFASGLSKEEMANPVFDADPEWKAHLLAESEIHRILKHFISVDDVEGIKLSLRALASDGDVNIRLDFTSETDSSWITPLKEAIRIGDVEIVERLIERGAQLSVVDHRQNTALHAAAYYGRPDLVGVFIRDRRNDKDIALRYYELDVNARNENGETPLLRLTRSRYTTGMGTFFSHSALAAPSITTGRVLETAKLLLAVGADVSAIDKHGRTPLVNVGGKGTVLGDLFLENGADEKEIERWERKLEEDQKKWKEYGQLRKKRAQEKLIDWLIVQQERLESFARNRGDGRNIELFLHQFVRFFATDKGIDEFTLYAQAFKGNLLEKSKVDGIDASEEGLDEKEREALKERWRGVVEEIWDRPLVGSEISEKEKKIDSKGSCYD